MYSDSLPLTSPLITSVRPMVACSIGDVTVFTGAAGLRVDGVNCVLGALSFECSIGSRPLIYVRALRRNCLVIVTMARSYQSAAGYGRSATGGAEAVGRIAGILLIGPTA